MAIGNAIYVPLFTETSVDVNSPFFTVAPGEIALLQAFGFADYKDRVDNTEQQVPQEACLEMLLFKEGALPPQKGSCPVRDLDKYRTLLLAQETMMRDGCYYALSKQNNIMLINIPGSYRLVLNDGTAVGTARVYLRMLSHEEFPWYTPFMIGD